VEVETQLVATPGVLENKVFPTERWLAGRPRKMKLVNCDEPSLQVAKTAEMEPAKLTCARPMKLTLIDFDNPARPKFVDNEMDITRGVTAVDQTSGIKSRVMLQQENHSTTELTPTQMQNELGNVFQVKSIG